jgi:hypothetical protein
VDWRPTPSNGMAKLQSIHGPRHVDVRKHRPNIATAFQQQYRFVRIARFQHCVSSVFHHTYSVHPDKGFIFDD